jgi:glycerol-3-phosphate dehydrogenase
MKPYDLLIIGGGINGAAIARDAAGRGHSVLLVEKGDLAGATSSASTKLIHGGLRYLEYYEFRLVREALIEREIMWRTAPHIIWPLEFVLPYAKHLRPRWMIRLGLFLYDHLGGRHKLPPSHGLRLRGTLEGLPLRDGYTQGFAYSDCWVDDARLVVLNAIDAAARGAEILTRMECTGLRREAGLWRATLHKDGEDGEVLAKVLVNAAGPWASKVRAMAEGGAYTKVLRLVKGSHFVVPKLYDGDHAYIFQNPDKRVIFAIPYEGEFTLIGTTEIDFHGDPHDAKISDAEITYLIDSANTYFRAAVRKDDIVWSYAGVRPLYDDQHANASAVTRDYVLQLVGDGEDAPLMSVLGGKITTSRRLAEHVMEKLSARMGWPDKPWTKTARLPGGDFPKGDFSALLHEVEAFYPWLPPALALRLARSYGTRINLVIGNAKELSGLGPEIVRGLYRAEVDYLRRLEWAETAEDILWRRSKLGLHAGADAAETLGAYLTQK